MVQLWRPRTDQLYTCTLNVNVLLNLTTIFTEWLGGGQMVGLGRERPCPAKQLYLSYVLQLLHHTTNHPSFPLSLFLTPMLFFYMNME